MGTYNPFYEDWTENQLRNAIWDANSGRHWRGPFCEVEELRSELLRRGLSPLGYHETVEQYEESQLKRKAAEKEAARQWRAHDFRIVL